MTLKRMDHVSVVVDDLAADLAFFTTVESVDDTVARLRAHGAELVGEVAQYKDQYRLCYTRVPAGIIVALAEEIAGHE